jgi:hypothetical protein
MSKTLVVLMPAPWAASASQEHYWFAVRPHQDLIVETQGLHNNRSRAGGGRELAARRVTVMRTLVIDGTGLISRGIVKHLLVRGAEVTVFNRGKSAGPLLPSDVRAVLGNRDDTDALSATAGKNFDVVIDMVCFRDEQAAAEAIVRALRIAGYEIKPV